MTLDLVKAAAYLLEKIERRPAPASEMINAYLSTHKHLKGQDKAAFLALVWGVIRAQARLAWAYPNQSWQERIEIFSQKGIPDVSTAPKHIQWEVPEWFESHIPEAEMELPALLEAPPVILRATQNPREVLDALVQEGIKAKACTKSPYGIKLTEYAHLKNTKVWKQGLIEVQDEGAQLVALDIGVKPRQSVFDFCAGAGGKSLIFAQMMQNKGFIQAYDITPKKLFELVKRATRAHITIIKIITKLERPDKKFDHVVVDAPCSGCGTWRRSPNLRWNLTEKQLAHIVKVQGEILEQAAAYVKPGHFLSYITCSLTRDENEDQVARFLTRHPTYHVIQQKRYSPARTDTDGFFLCVMQKN
ncbi:MAG: RsmB/NOP family class I SAM-dependent RNA methyltransferase [Alphaproteobacteria bacterium]